MLRPVIRENSDASPDQLIESVCHDAIISGRLLRNTEQDQIRWRRWNLNYKRRCFWKARAGRKFPVAGYRATRKIVMIRLDDDNNLTWVDIKEVVK
jgi:hypothetical protein